MSMNFSSPHLSTDWLRRADAVARAVHLWVKRRALQHLCEGKEESAAAARGYAFGLIEGLAGSLELTLQEHQTVAYVFCLLNGNEKDALDAARALLDMSGEAAASSSYLHGLSDAHTLYLGAHLATMQQDETVAERPRVQS